MGASPIGASMIRIEKLKEADVSAYSKLIQGVISNTPYYSKWAKREESMGYPSEWIKRDIKNRKKLFLCAKDKNKLVGFLFGSVNTGMLHLGWLGVDAKYRKQGVAEKLMKKEVATQKLVKSVLRRCQSESGQQVIK